MSGQVNFQQPNASVLNVTNSPGAIINWQGFSIGASEVTRFVQQSAASSVLNRVTGGNVSQIYGQLLSNGRVFLINPGGIVVGPGAIVDTAGFVASTLNMLDSDFLAGNLRFHGDASSGSIINQGWIRTGYGGHVLLVAPTIENSGLIHTPGGDLILAAGQKVTMSSLDLAGVQLEVQAPTDSVVNVGKLLADGGAVGVFAGTLRHTGEIRANSLVYDEAGKVVLKAQNEIQVAAGSSTSADGKSGGSVTVQSGGSTRVAGSVSATGTQGQGGSISVLGDRVALVESAALNASGSAGGGQILVGGDYQGANPAIQNSTSTFIGSTAALKADATQNGDGGRVIVWSDDKTQVYGTLSAQGGAQGGNGGFAEISGKQGLVFQGSASLGAPLGGPGTLLLDPLDLYVFAAGGIDLASINELTEFPSNAATVSPATLDAAGASVVLQASRYMRITDAIALNTPGAGLSATVSPYTAPALPDPLALSTSTPNRLDLAAGITTVGGAVTLNAPTIQNVAALPISIATSGGAIGLTAASQILGSNLSLNAAAGTVTTTTTPISGSSIQLASITGSTFTASAPFFIFTGAITTTGNIDVASSGSSVSTGIISAGSGAVSLSGASIFSTVNTTGAVTLTSSSSSINTTVNGASSLTATSPSSIFIGSTTDLNIANVTAGANATAQVSTTGGSIRGTTAASTVKGLDVQLLTTAGTGGGIGTAGTALNVDVQRGFTFRPNGDFNILLTGTGPNQLNAQLTPAASVTYTGTLTKQGGGLTLNASADTSTVTVSSLNITSGFDQVVFFGSPSITLQTTNAANLVVTSMNVPTGDTVSTVPLPNGQPLPVVVSSAGNLTLTNYTRAPGGLAKTTSLTASGSMTLGTVDASKDTVTANAFGGGATVGSLISTGNITLQAFGGALNAQTNSTGVEITSGGTLSIFAQGIGTNGFSNPFDMAAATISLTSSASGAVGGTGTEAVVANTTNLSLNAASGSTFNITTGATSLTNLTVSANPFAVGDAGLARVVTAGGAATYDFDALAGNFTFNPPVSTGRDISFTSSIGNIALGAADLGTGSLALTSNSGSILTSGASIISAAAVTLNAATDIDFSAGLLPSGTITATGNIGLHGRSNVITGALNTPGQLAVDGNFGCSFCTPTVSVGTIGGTSTPSAITMTGDTITATGAITGAGDVTLNATGGALTLGGALATADGKTIDLTHSGVGIFQFDRINAGATGTVNITSFGPGIEQTADGGADGITAKTVSLFASTGPIHNSADSINFRLDLLGTTNLTVNTSGVARFDMHGSTLTDLTITKNALPATSPFAMANLAVGQSVVIQNGTSGPLEVGVSSTTPLNFSLDTSSLAGTAMTFGTPTGIVSGGGDVMLTSGGGIGSLSSGPISSGAGDVTLSALGSVNTAGGITTTTGNVNVSAFGGDITTGAITTSGGSIQLDASQAVTVSGNLSTGAGTIVLLGGTSISRSGAFSISSNTSVSATAFDGDIGTSGSPMLITSPTVNLDAIAGATPGTGRAFATLTGTTTLEVIGDHGFNVSSDTALTALSVETLGSGTGTPGAGTLNLTAPGQTYTFARPAADLFGPVTNTFQVVAAGGATPPATMRFTALDGTLLVAGPSAVSAADLTLSSAFGGNVSLQGTAANPLTLSGTTQTFSAGTDLLIRGTVSLSATANQSFSAGGNITVNADAGGGGMVAIAAPSQTFSTSGAASKMEFLGGAAAAEKVTVTSTNSQFVQTSSSSLDAFKLLGGSGADSSVTFTHSGTGAQTFNMSTGTLTVAGGSGSNSVAKLEETGTSTQRICFVTFFSCDPILSLNVLGGAGTGAFAQVTSAGTQDLRVSGTALNTGTTIKGGTGVGAYALVQAASSQSLQNGGRLLVEAGAANDSSARMIAGGTQNLNVNALSLIAKGIDSAGFQNASAIIEGAGQSISVGVGGVTINAGSGTAAGTPSDALLRNTAGSQFVSASGAIILDGGHQFSTAGIINAGTGAQTVFSSGSGITLRSDTDGTHSPHADSVVAIQNQAATLQSFSVTGGGLRLTNSGGGTVGVTSAGSQDLNAMFVEVLTNPSTEAGPNSATISAATEQHIFTTNTSTSGFPSMRVAALGTGTASVQAGTAQLIELDYPAQMQLTNRDGRLIIGDVNAAGISRVRAGDPLLATPLGNQTIFAQSITVQAGLVNSISELKATGVQVVSTLQGGIDVLGGSGDNSLAQIDPVQQTILSNGSIQVIAGSGVNANAQIIAASSTTPNGQTILTTNGDIVLEAGGPSGTSASSAFIINTGSSSFVGTSGEIFLTAGTVPGADAIINVGNGPGVLTFLCGAGCSLPPAGTSPTGGILANGVAGGPSSPPPSSSASSVVASATNPILTVEENLELVLVEIAPEGIGEDPLLTRRAPGCL